MTMPTDPAPRGADAPRPLSERITTLGHSSFDADGQPCECEKCEIVEEAWALARALEDGALAPASPVPAEATSGADDTIECPDCEGVGGVDCENSLGEITGYNECMTCEGAGRLNAERWMEAAVMSAFLTLGSWKDGTRDNEYAKDRLRWLFNKGAALTPAAPTTTKETR